MRFHRRDQRRVVANAGTVVPRRTRQTQRPIGTPGTEPVIGLYRQAQFQPPSLA